MKTLAVAALLGLASLGSGCGGATAPSAVRSAPDSTRTTVYFLVDDATAPTGVRRTVEKPSPRGALTALLAGPTAEERRAGVTTAIPRRTQLLSLSFRGYGGTDAVVDLRGLPPADEADAVQKVRAITQVARTLIGVSGIRRVWIRVDGRPWGLWDHDGDILDRPYTYETLLGWYGVCTSKPRTETVPDECFTALP